MGVSRRQARLLESLLHSGPFNRTAMTPRGAVGALYCWQSLIVILTVCLTLLSGQATGSAQEATAAPPGIASSTPPENGEPGTCLVGMAIESIHDLNLIDKTFDADFWIWSVCEDDRFSPLSTMEFLNANAVHMELDGSEVVDDVTWSYARVSGTFRHHWNLTRFPFDNHVLKIIMEDTAFTTTDFVYEADASDPIPNGETDTKLERWEIVDRSLEASTAHYQTSYGDPRDPRGTSDYSQLIFEVHLERSDLTGFIKLTFVVYIAFMISLISYFLHLDGASLLLARFSVISATVFAVALSMNRVTSELGTDDGITLIDMIHISALFAILVDGVAALKTHMRIQRGDSEDSLRRFNMRVLTGVVITFILVNAVLILVAALQ
jgi:hypothetical protein